MRYRLRTLMIVLAVGPAVLALAWWYCKFAIGLFVLALIVCPAVIFDAAMLFCYSFGALCHLFGERSRDKSNESD